MSQQIIRKARNVREGDTIPGLDNAYVFEVETDADLRTEYNTSITDGMIVINFHTSEGEESYLICPPDMPITIVR